MNAYLLLLYDYISEAELTSVVHGYCLERPFDTYNWTGFNFLIDQNKRL